MINYKQVAEILFLAHTRIMLKKIGYHLERRSWEDLEAIEKCAWIAAAKAAHKELKEVK